jgi:antitoxin VapB
MQRESDAMNTERHVRLFRNGRNQAVRIPRDMELEGEEAILRSDGKRLIIEPIPTTPLLTLLARLKPIDDRFPDIDTGLLPADDVRI